MLQQDRLHVILSISQQWRDLLDSDNNHRDPLQELKDRRRQENRTHLFLISMLSLFLALILLAALRDHVNPLLFKVVLGVLFILDCYLMSLLPQLPTRRHKRNQLH